MFDRPIVRFVAGALLGVIAAFSISFGLFAAGVALAVVALMGLAWKSYAALSGGLMGIGLTWVVLCVLAFSLTLNNGPASGGGERYLLFLLWAGFIFLTGVAIGVVGIVRHRARRQNRPA